MTDGPSSRTSPVELSLDLDGGGRATLVATDGNAVTVHSTRAAPPGTPLTGLDAEGSAFQIKVRACRRVGTDAQGQPRFLVEGRWVNLSREQRRFLVGS